MGDEVLYRGNPRVLLTEIGDGTGVLLHLETRFYYTLNASGIALWRRLADGGERGTSEAELADDLVERFDVDPATALRDVRLVLDELAREGLVARHAP